MTQGASPTGTLWLQTSRAIGSCTVPSGSSFRVQKSFIQASIAFTDQRYEAVIKLSADYRLENEDWLRLTLITLDIQNDRDGVLKLISKIDPQMLKRPSSYALINHMRYKHDDDRERVLPYMKREVIANMHVGDDYQYLNYIMNDATRIFSSTAPKPKENASSIMSLNEFNAAIVLKGLCKRL